MPAPSCGSIAPLSLLLMTLWNSDTTLDDQCYSTQHAATHMVIEGPDCLTYHRLSLAYISVQQPTSPAWFRPFRNSSGRTRLLASQHAAAHWPATCSCWGQYYSCSRPRMQHLRFPMAAVDEKVWQRPPNLDRRQQVQRQESACRLSTSNKAGQPHGFQLQWVQGTYVQGQCESLERHCWRLRRLCDSDQATARSLHSQTWQQVELVVQP